MLLFLILCTFIQSLRGKPLAPPLSPNAGVTANIIAALASDSPAAPDDGDQQLRTVNDIVQSCIFTILACVWTSIHPNINGPRDSWWACTKRKVVTTLYAVIAPEMILLWALRQRFAAKEIADQYNKEFKTLEERETSLWVKFKQLFQPLHKFTTRRGAKQPWTITHGFFIQMGGFILYNGEYPKMVLDYDNLVQLLRKNDIDAPTVTERDLQDRSKGDTISKGIVVLQTTWFVLQCIVRATQRLPLSELEVLTLAFAVMNGAIYTAWWSKPQDVDMAICVPLKQPEVKDGVENSSHPAPSILHHADHQQFGDNQPLMDILHTVQQPDEDIDEEENWLRRKLWKDRDNHSLPVFLLFSVPYRLLLWVLHQVSKMADSDIIIGGRLRVPMFYSSSGSTYAAQRIACIVGAVFGSIHLLGWTSEFPSLRDRILWHVSAIVLTCAPFTFLAADALDLQNMDEMAGCSFKIFLTLIPLYIVARFIIITIAFKTIVHPPDNVLRDISWTRYIPHL